MLDQIRQAQKSITFETYIYWSGDVGAAFTKALVERADAGVKIHLIIDAVGSAKMDPIQLGEMTKAGAEIERYRAIRWYNLDKINNRTHRKLLVVDGKVGFTGGVGIADKWDGDADSPDHWRDTHFRVVGPVVGQMQATFVEHWLATRGVLLQGDAYFPQLFVFRPRRALRPHADRRAPAGRRRPDHRAGPADRQRGDPRGLSPEMGATAGGGCLHLRIPAHDVPLQGHGGRRSVGFGRFDQLRQSVLSIERRGQSECPRSARGPAGTAGPRKDRLRSSPITLDEWHHRPLLDRVGDWFAGLVGSQL